MSDLPIESLLRLDEPVPLHGFDEDEAGLTRKGALPPLEGKPKVEEVLSQIFPPRRWLEGDVEYEQKVSSAPSTREDVSRLREMLDTKLMERQARESGICPVREQLFSQCFDEIIRQVTINFPERGLLLNEVRKEIKMTISAYQTMYQSAVTFGMRKETQSQKGIEELEA